MYQAEFVQFPTADGFALPGLLFQAKDSKRIIIYLHGNGSSSVFYEDNYILAEELMKKEISLLLFNNRGAHIIKKLNRKMQNGKIDRLMYGMAYEKIKDCVLDIEAAQKFLEKRGFKTFYLAGASTGANKICVYDHFRPKNKFSKYIILCGGDDTGIYYDMLGKKRFYKLLKTAKEKMKNRKDNEIIKELLPDEWFSYKAFYDIANPDGDYNCFPYLEVIRKVKLSKKPLFRYFKGIKKSSIVVYGELDEYAWGDVPRVVNILKKYQPNFVYKIIPGADHGFTGKDKELAQTIISSL